MLAIKMKSKRMKKPKWSSSAGDELRCTADSVVERGKWARKIDKLEEELSVVTKLIRVEREHVQRLERDAKAARDAKCARTERRVTASIKRDMLASGGLTVDSLEREIFRLKQKRTAALLSGLGTMDDLRLRCAIRLSDQMQDEGA
jgi:hypothetical protein